jgi:hypothetical protein
MEAVDTSEMLVSIYQTKRCHIPDDSNIDSLKQGFSNYVIPRASKRVHTFTSPSSIFVSEIAVLHIATNPYQTTRLQQEHK